MSNVTRSIYTANPAIFDATQQVVSIGDLVVDPAGINAPGIVRGPNAARTVSLLGTLPGPDTVLVVVSTPAAATVRFTMTFRDSTGAPRANTIVTGVVAGNFAIAATFSSGNGVVSQGGTTTEGLYVGITSLAGILALDVVGTPADLISGAATDVTGTPVLATLAGVVPP
jgi:hypothetical protein